ncbi:hypothetical protein J6590_085476 [Homalodisca vitripennis]|nr:hypothetical protein J6590_085476 [Homalodisca vitripennis]
MEANDKASETAANSCDMWRPQCAVSGVLDGLSITGSACRLMVFPDDIRCIEDLARPGAWIMGLLLPPPLWG